MRSAFTQVNMLDWVEHLFMLELTDIIKGFSMCSLSPESSSKNVFKEPSWVKCVFWGFWQSRVAGVMWTDLCG